MSKPNSKHRIDDNSNIKSLGTACPHLEQLLISDNKIKNLQTITQLSELKQLQELDFRNNPVAEKLDSNH